MQSPLQFVADVEPHPYESDGCGAWKFLIVKPKGRHILELVANVQDRGDGVLWEHPDVAESRGIREAFVLGGGSLSYHRGDSLVKCVDTSNTFGSCPNLGLVGFAVPVVDQLRGRGCRVDRFSSDMYFAPEFMDPEAIDPPNISKWAHLGYRFDRRARTIEVNGI